MKTYRNDAIIGNKEIKAGLTDAGWSFADAPEERVGVQKWLN